MPAKEIKLDLEKCTGCKTCVDSCFLDVIRWNDKEDRPYIAYPEDCVWCCTCEINCPAHCIEVIPVVNRFTPSTL